MPQARFVLVEVSAVTAKPVLAFRCRTAAPALEVLVMAISQVRPLLYLEQAVYAVCVGRRGLLI